MAQLESILAGVTNANLLGSIASVDSLCTEVGAQVVPQLNTIGSGLSGLSLGGTIPLGLTLPAPAVPPLDAFACP